MYDTLREILKEEAVLKHYNSEQNSFYIKESDTLAKCKKIEFLGFEHEDTTFGFELDCKDKSVKCGNLQKLSPYFKDGKHLDKGNDAIIFATIENKDYLFICELKDDSGSSKLDKQFKSSSAFVDYLKSILDNFYNINISKIKPIYIVFSKHGNNLRPTGGSRSSTIDYRGLDVYFQNCREKVHIKSFI
ncbi:MAG: hypothetical protein U9N49_05950 [Campylobacterota bacterium]|nr:hypothetical protein [Campylobacterota bacterium]